MAGQGTERAKNLGIPPKAGRINPNSITSLKTVYKTLKDYVMRHLAKAQYVVYFNVAAEADVRGVLRWSGSLLSRVLQVLAGMCLSAGGPTLTELPGCLSLHLCTRTRFSFTFKSGSSPKSG